MNKLNNSKNVVKVIDIIKYPEESIIIMEKCHSSLDKYSREFFLFRKNFFFDDFFFFTVA